MHLPVVGLLIATDIEHGYFAACGFAVIAAAVFIVFDGILVCQSAPTGIDQNPALRLKFKRLSACGGLQSDRIHVVGRIGQLRCNRPLPNQAIQGALLVIFSGFFVFKMCRPDGFVAFLRAVLFLKAPGFIRKIPALAFGKGANVLNAFFREINAVGPDVGYDTLFKQLLRELRSHFGIEFQAHACRLQHQRR